MAKLSMVSVGALTLILALVLACGGLGLAVREGVAKEMLLWFPPTGKYQLIIRVGPDALPWNSILHRSTAINIWAHGRGTDWHVFKILGVPLGDKFEDS